MFPLDDSRFYTAPEMERAMLSAVNFVHVSEARIRTFLEEHFAKFTDEKADLIRAYNSGLLPRLYRPAETLEAAISQLGSTCLVCRGSSNALSDMAPARWLTQFPAVSVINADTEGWFYRESQGQEGVCYPCAHAVGREAKKAGAGWLNPYQECASSEMFFSCMIAALKQKGMRQRIKENASAHNWRFDPLTRHAATA
jgi:hypothetical protein